MENEIEVEPLTIYISGSEGAETRLNLSDVSLNFMRFFSHLSFNYLSNLPSAFGNFFLANLSNLI